MSWLAAARKVNFMGAGVDFFVQRKCVRYGFNSLAAGFLYVLFVGHLHCLAFGLLFVYWGALPVAALILLTATDFQQLSCRQRSKIELPVSGSILIVHYSQCLG